MIFGQDIWDYVYRVTQLNFKKYTRKTATL